MNQQPRNFNQRQQLIPLVMVGTFITIQLLLILILWFLSGQGAVKPSWSAFVNSVSTSWLNQALLIGAAAAVVLQQALKTKFINSDNLTVVHLIILLGLGELPGLLGFFAAIIDNHNVSLALPFIFVSLILFMSLKSVALNLVETK